MYKQFLSIVLSLIMLTGMSASSMAYAQTDDIKKEDSIKIKVNEIKKDNEREGSDDDSNQTEDGIEIEVDVEDGIAKIKIEIEDEESRFKIMWVDKLTTVKEIALRTDLSIEQISSSISFEFKEYDKRVEHDDDKEEYDKRVEHDDDKDKDKHDNPEKFAEKQAKAEEKRIIKLAKVEAKIAKVQERLAEKLTKLEEKLT